MIQTINTIVYGDRDEKSGKIMIEIFPMRTTKEGTYYLVIDWDISKPENTDPYKSKEVFYENARINMLDAHIEANYAAELVGLSKTDKEWKKMQIALMIDTTTNLFQSNKTVYSLEPSDWEFTSITE